MRTKEYTKTINWEEEKRMKYSVELSSHGNIDHGENPYKPLAGVEQGIREADTIEELQKIVNTYISEGGFPI